MRTIAGTKAFSVTSCRKEELLFGGVNTASENVF